MTREAAVIGSADSSPVCARRPAPFGPRVPFGEAVRLVTAARAVAVATR